MNTPLPKRAKGLSYITQFFLLSLVALAVYGLLFLLLNNDLLEGVGLQDDTSGFEWADKILGVTVALAGAWVTLAIAQRTLRNSEEMEILQLRSHVKEDLQTFHDFFEALNKLYAKSEDIAAKAMQAYIDGLNEKISRTANTDQSGAAVPDLKLTLSTEDLNELRGLRNELLALNRALEIHSANGRGPLALGFQENSLCRTVMAHNEWVERANLTSKRKLGAEDVPKFDPEAISTEIAYEEFKAKRLSADDLKEVHAQLALIFRKEWLGLMSELIGYEVHEMEMDRDRIHAAMDQNSHSEWAEESAKELEYFETKHEALVQLSERLTDAWKNNEQPELTEEMEALLHASGGFSTRAPGQEQLDVLEKEAKRMLWRIQQLKDELEHHLACSSQHLDSLRTELAAGLAGYNADDFNQENGSYRYYVAQQMKREKSRLLSAVQTRDTHQRDFIHKAIALILGEVLFPHYLPRPVDDEHGEANLNLGMAYLYDLLSALPADMASLMSSSSVLGAGSRIHDVYMADILNRPLPIQISLRRLCEAANGNPDLFVQQYDMFFEQDLGAVIEETAESEASGPTAIVAVLETERSRILRVIRAKKELTEKGYIEGYKEEESSPATQHDPSELSFGDEIPF